MIRHIMLLLTLCAFKVHDGDTITKLSYRLAYIDAPELNQTCHVDGKKIAIGELSRDHLANLSKMVDQCRIVNFDRYGRAVVDCPFNMLMVHDGMALCYDQYINDSQVIAFCHEMQDYARGKKLGVWACSDFVEPRVWRKR